MGKCHVVRKAGTPTVTSDTPTSTGDHYVDTLTGDNYRSEGTSTPADWILDTSGVTSHNALTDLLDDDHTQYNLNIDIQDEGSSLSARPIKIDFVGGGVTVTEPVTDEILVTIPSGGSGTSMGYRLSFASQEHQGIKAKSATYAILATMIFDGSTIVGTPSKIKITFTRKSGATSTLSVKIFDLTNSLQIVEKTGLSPAVDGTFEIADLGALSNIPAGADNVWEVQALLSSTGGGEESLIGYLQMEF